MLHNEMVPKVPPKRGTEIDEIARQTLLKAFSFVQNVFQQNALIDFFDKGGLSELGFDYGVSELRYGEEARYDPGSNSIILSPETYGRLYVDNPRARFTLAHELGHATMHGAFLKSALDGRQPFQKVSRATLVAFMDPEWQANRFAGAFLMPSSVLRQFLKTGMSKKKIAETLRVSLVALSIRLQTINR